MVLSSLMVKRDVDALLIVPPFASLDKPALGAHILQACAREAGFTVATFYANLLFAAEIGEANYLAVCFNSSSELIGERLFAASAYAVPPLGRSAIDRTALPIRSSVRGGVQLDLPNLQLLEQRAATWLDDLTSAVLRLDCKLVGCSTTFQQTAASVALLKRIKHARPEIVTIIGGANCVVGPSISQRRRASLLCRCAPKVDRDRFGRSDHTRQSAGRSDGADRDHE